MISKHDLDINLNEDGVYYKRILNELEKCEFSSLDRCQRTKVITWIRNWLSAKASWEWK